MYFKSNVTTASTTYDECNYAKSINTNDSADETENNPKTNDTDYEERECCSKNCNCIITEDDYYDYEDTEGNHENDAYEKNDYDEYNYAEDFENEYDDVLYESEENQPLKEVNRVSSNLTIHPYTLWK